MIKAIVVSVALVLSFALTACDSGPLQDASFAARAGEEPFNVEYHFNSRLPTSEESFVSFLRSRGLSYEISSGRGAIVTSIDPPQLRNLDISMIRNTYDIYDKARSNNRRVVHYIAYVSYAGEVVYVENRFQYRGM